MRKKKTDLKKSKKKKTNEKNRLRLKKTDVLKKSDEKNRLRLKKSDVPKNPDVKSVKYLNIGGHKVKAGMIQKKDGTKGFFFHTKFNVGLEIRITIKSIRCSSVKYLYDQFINETINKEAIDEEIKKLVEQGHIIVDDDGTITRLIDERWEEWVD